MRGLAFVGGAFPLREYAREENQAEPDVVVAADSGLIAAEAWGLRADWIVGDMDSLPDLSMLDHYPDDRILRSSPAKDDTDTELALQLLRRLGCDRVEIIGGGGGRLDHLLAIASLFDRADAPSRWVTEAEEVTLLDSVLEFNCRPHELVSVFPVGNPPWGAVSVGLRWPLEPVAWSRGSFGVSNETVADRCSIESRSGRFMIIRSLAKP